MSARSLGRARLLTLTIIATVGLGLGATTTIFSAVNAALLKPLPYAEPSRLAWIYTDAPPFEFRFSAVDYLALQEQQTGFERIAAFTDRTLSFSDGVTADLLRGRAVSWTYFGVLGIRPAFGRDFAESDGRVGAPPAVILSDAFWQQRLGGRRDIIGASVRLDGVDYTIVGVLPPIARPLERRQEFFAALQIATPSRRGPFPYFVIGRLKPGVDTQAAASELRAINRRVFPLWQTSYQDDKATWNLKDLQERLVGYSRTMANLALSAVALVWLIASLNASNLLVARAVSRRRELSVRTALGATRQRLLRHLLAEAALLAAGAASVGVVLAVAGVQLLQSVGSTYFPRVQEIGVDGTLLLVFATLTTATALLFALIPAVQGMRASAEEMLHTGERTATASRAIERVRRALVAGQFAVATPLLIGAVLLAASLDALHNVDVGFDETGMISGSIRLPAALYPAPASRVYWDELERRLAGLPGVQGVAFSDSRPPATASNVNNFDLELFPTPAGQSQPATPFVAVTPQYFGVLGVTLRSGRLLTVEDATRETLESVVVDEAWARRFFPGDTALGKRFKEGGCTECPWTTVVGVVSTVRFEGLGQPANGVVYTPLAPSQSRFVLLRTDQRIDGAAAQLQRAVRDLDPNVPLTDVATTGDLIDESLQQPRALTWLIVAFAAVALVLSVIGIYGVMSYYVQQHAREIGIRLALGGTSQRVIRTVVGDGAIVVMIGVAVGIIAALASGRLIAGLLFGVTATDATTYGAVVTFLIGLGVLACFVPARRAASMSPAAILRDE